jgi:uncharacterized membrane protein YeaQ/YmgE (transglycosylase-associated protein family)
VGSTSSTVFLYPSIPLLRSAWFSATNHVKQACPAEQIRISGMIPALVVVDIILGLLGGVLGGWIFNMLGIWPGGGLIGSIIVAFLGAVILVWITRLLKKA